MKAELSDEDVSILRAAQAGVAMAEGAVPVARAQRNVLLRHYRRVRKIRVTELSRAVELHRTQVSRIVTGDGIIDHAEDDSGTD